MQNLSNNFFRRCKMDILRPYVFVDGKIIPEFAGNGTSEGITDIDPSNTNMTHLTQYGLYTPTPMIFDSLQDAENVIDTIPEGGIVMIDDEIDGEPWRGLSAYQIWLQEGNTGTKQDFLESLKGQTGFSNVNPRGIWDAAIDDYVFLDVVVFKGSTGSNNSYVALGDVPIGTLPTDEDWWAIWVAQGPRGLQGEKGEKGVQGEQGIDSNTGQFVRVTPDLSNIQPFVPISGAGSTLNWVMTQSFVAPESGYVFVNAFVNMIAVYIRITRNGATVGADGSVATAWTVATPGWIPATKGDVIRIASASPNATANGIWHMTENEMAGTGSTTSRHLFWFAPIKADPVDISLYREWQAWQARDPANTDDFVTWLGVILKKRTNRVSVRINNVFVPASTTVILNHTITNGDSFMSNGTRFIAPVAGQYVLVSTVQQMTSPATRRVLHIAKNEDAIAVNTERIAMVDTTIDFNFTPNIYGSCWLEAGEFLTLHMFSNVAQAQTNVNGRFTADFYLVS